LDDIFDYILADTLMCGPLLGVCKSFARIKPKLGIYVEQTLDQDIEGGGTLMKLFTYLEVP